MRIQYASSITPPAPTLAVVSGTTTAASAGTYTVWLVTQCQGGVSLYGDGTSQAIAAGQGLSITVPATAQPSGASILEILIAIALDSTDPLNSSVVASASIQNGETLPYVVELNEDEHFVPSGVVPTVGGLPSGSEKLHGQRRLVSADGLIYRSDNYDGVEPWKVDELADFTPFVSESTDSFLGADRDVRTISDFSTIVRQDYPVDGSTSSPVIMWLVNDTNQVVTQGTPIALAAAYEPFDKASNDLFGLLQIQFLGYVDLTTGVLDTSGMEVDTGFRPYQGPTSSGLVLQKDLPANSGYVIATYAQFNVAQLNGQAPQGAELLIAPYFSQNNAERSPAGAVVGDHILVKAGEGARRVVPDGAGLFPQALVGSGTVKDFSFSGVGQISVLGMLANTPSQLAVISNTGVVFIAATVENTYALRAVVGTVDGPGQESGWHGMIALNNTLLLEVTITHPTAIRGSYPDVIAGIETGYNHNKVRVSVRPIGEPTNITYWDIAVSNTPGSTEVLLFGAGGTATTAIAPVDADFGCFSYDTGSTLATQAGASVFESKTYEINVQPLYENTVTTISHSTQLGCLPEQALTIVELTQKVVAPWRFYSTPDSPVTPSPGERAWANLSGSGSVDFLLPPASESQDGQEFYLYSSGGSVTFDSVGYSNLAIHRFVYNAGVWNYIPPASGSGGGVVWTEITDANSPLVAIIGTRYFANPAAASASTIAITHPLAPSVGDSWSLWLENPSATVEGGGVLDQVLYEYVYTSDGWKTITSGGGSGGGSTWKIITFADSPYNIANGERILVNEASASEIQVAEPASGQYALFVQDGKVSLGGNIVPQGHLFVSQYNGSTFGRFNQSGWVSPGQGEGSIVTCFVEDENALDEGDIVNIVGTTYESQSFNDSFMGNPNIGIDVPDSSAVGGVSVGRQLVKRTAAQPFAIIFDEPNGYFAIEFISDLTDDPISFDLIGYKLITGDDLASGPPLDNQNFPRDWTVEGGNSLGSMVTLDTINGNTSLTTFNQAAYFPVPITGTYYKFYRWTFTLDDQGGERVHFKHIQLYGSARVGSSIDPVPTSDMILEGRSNLYWRSAYGLDRLSDVTIAAPVANSDGTIQILASPLADGNYIPVNYSPPGGGGSSQILVSATDTTAGYLSEKILGQNGLAFSIVNGGGDEDLVADGINLSLGAGKWISSTATGSPPAGGTFRFDAVIGSATVLRLHKTDTQGHNKTDLTTSILQTGNIIFAQQPDNLDNFWVTAITGRTDQTTYWDVDINTPSVEGSFVDAATYVLTVFPGSASVGAGEIKVDAGDTVGFLEDKLSQGAGVTIAKTGPVGDRQLEISSTGGGTSAVGIGSWDYNNATGTPAAGEVRFDNASVGSATIVRVHKTDNGSVDRENLVKLIAFGKYLYVQDLSSQANYWLMEITGATDFTSYCEFTINTPTVIGAIANSQAAALKILPGLDLAQVDTLDTPGDLESKIAPTGANITVSKIGAAGNRQLQIDVTGISGTATFLGLGLWDFDVATGVPPGGGDYRFDAAIGSATALRISDQTVGSIDKGLLLGAAIQAGSLLYAQQEDNEANFWFAEVTSVADGGTYWDVNISTPTVGGTIADNARFIIRVIGGGGAGAAGTGAMELAAAPIVTAGSQATASFSGLSGSDHYYAVVTWKGSSEGTLLINFNGDSVDTNYDSQETFPRDGTHNSNDYNEGRCGFAAFTAGNGGVQRISIDRNDFTDNIHFATQGNYQGSSSPSGTGYYATGLHKAGTDTDINEITFKPKTGNFDDGSVLVLYRLRTTPAGTAGGKTEALPYTLTTSDSGVNILLTGTGALNIPDAVAGSFPDGWNCNLILDGSGHDATITSTGGTLLLSGGATNNHLSTENGRAKVILYNPSNDNKWSVSGDLST